MDLHRTLPTSAERLALILKRDEPSHRFTVFGDDDAMVMAGDIVKDLEAFSFERGSGDFGGAGHGLVIA